MKLNVAIVANGGSPYGYIDQARFKSDAQQVINYFISKEPFKSRANDLQFHPLWNTQSLDAYKDGRWLTVNQSKARAVVQAAGVPVERGLVLVHGAGYGGSGSIPFAVASNGDKMRKVALHEFGHALGGLHDEYLRSTTAGPVDNRLTRNCWMGAAVPTGVGGTWAQGCRYPNWWRQKAVRQDGTLGESLMKNVDAPAFNAVSIQLLNAAIDYWVSQP